MNQAEIDAAGNAAEKVQEERAMVPVGSLDPMVVIEARNKWLDRVLDAAIKATHPGQWTNIGGKPWPGGPACEAMARRVGMRIDQTSMEPMTLADDKGEYQLWVSKGRFSLPGNIDSIEAIGTCSTRDTFLGTETTEGRPLSKVDVGSIMKAAYTNMEVNGTTRLLGVRGLTWERLKGLGIDKDAISSVEFQHGAQGGGHGGASADLLDQPLKYGGERTKGKTPRELSAEDLRWYIEGWDKDLKDPAKSKYHGRTKKLLDSVLAMLEERKKGAPAPTGAATPYQRIIAYGQAHSLGESALRPLIKEVTGKSFGKDLVDDDVKKVVDAIDAEERKLNDAMRNEEKPL